MQLRIKFDQVYQCVVSPRDMLLTTKTRVHALTGVEPRLQRLLLAGEQLNDYADLEESGVQPDATLQLVTRVLGGDAPPTPGTTDGASLQLCCATCGPAQYVRYGTGTLDLLRIAELVTCPRCWQSCAWVTDLLLCNCDYYMVQVPTRGEAIRRSGTVGRETAVHVPLSDIHLYRTYRVDVWSRRG